MDIIFLGTSSGVPTRARNVSSMALRLPQRAEMWLFDCGEGTQHQLFRSPLNISQLSRIFITHMHGDHTLGVMGLLSSAGMTGKVKSVNLYGPSDLKEFVAACGRYTQTRLPYPIFVSPVEPGIVVEDEEFTVACAPLKHRIPTFGYRVVEKDRPGRFLVEKAAALGVPAGPLYARLKRGETLTLADGREIPGRELCEPPEPGRIVAYCTDTMYCEAAVSLARNADLLVHECTYAQMDKPLAVRAMHSTSRMAAQVALEAGAKHLIVTHFSPRYTPDTTPTLDDVVAEARAIFPNTEAAYDFLTYSIPRNRVKQTEKEVDD